MGYLSPSDLPDAVQAAIRSDDFESIKWSVSEHCRIAACARQESPRTRSEQVADPQNVLDACLSLAMRSASLKVLDILLDRGARLGGSAFSYAMMRGEIAVLQLLIDHGWDIDSTGFELTAVQYVSPTPRSDLG